MNSRERTLRALKFGGPDRVPLMHRTLPGAFRVHGRGLEELYARYPSDVILSPSLRAPFAFAETTWEGAPSTGHSVDEWGCVWDRLTSDHSGQVVGFPLADWRNLASYRPPDPSNGRQGVDEMVRVVQEDRHQHYVMVSAGSLWHRLTFLRGFENALIDLAEGRDEFLRLRDWVAQYLLRRIELWTQQEEVDGILIGDDWGTQQSLMIAPSLWRHCFKGTYRMLVQAIHDGGALAHFHTDGNTWEIIPDLIEIGFDDINPQLSCMDVRALGREYGGKVCFRADLDRQHILPFGLPQDVEEHVHEAFEALGRFGGGYIGYGQIGADVPLCNAEAMLRTICSLTY